MKHAPPGSSIINILPLTLTCSPFLRKTGNDMTEGELSLKSNQNHEKIEKSAGLQGEMKTIQMLICSQGSEVGKVV
jgi:hypothetical protein